MADSTEDTSTWTPGGSSDMTKTDPYASTATESGGGWGSTDDNGGSTWTPASTSNGQSNESNVPTIPKEEPIDYGAQRGQIQVDASTMGAADGEQAPVWFIERVCIQLRKNDQFAVIKEVDNNSAMVEMDDKNTLRVSSGECTMVAPKEGDIVLVTGGADVGVEGELVCIDGSDAILKDSNEDFKIVDLIHLAKIVSEA